MKFTIITSVVTSALTTVLVLFLVPNILSNQYTADYFLTEDEETAADAGTGFATPEEIAARNNLQRQTYERLGQQITALEEYLQTDTSITAEQRELHRQNIERMKAERQQIASDLAL